MGRILLILLLLSTLVVSPVQAQAPELDDRDKSVYFGLNWGAAGITKVLMELQSADFITKELSETVNNSITKALNAIWENRYTSSNGTTYTTWGKTSDSSIYPAQKYGSAGIMKVFLQAADYFSDKFYLEWSNKTINELYKEAANTNSMPHWAYSYSYLRGQEGISITDINFGSLGIIDTSLKYYQEQPVEYYLRKAVNATKWVYNISVYKDVNGRTNRIIPWYESEKEIENTFSAYYYGNSGALPILHKLSQLTNNSTWSTWSDFIRTWLLSWQRDDGAWTYYPPFTANRALTNLEQGVAGVILGLIESLKYSPSEQVEIAITEGLDWLQQISREEDDVFFIPTEEQNDNGKHSLFEGLAGIARIFRIYKYQSSFVGKIYNWIMETALYSYFDGSTQVIGLLPSISTGDYSDLSYAYGLMGVAEELYYAYQSDIDFKTKKDIPEMLIDIINTIIHFQKENGLWQRQVDIPQIYQPNLVSNARTQIIIIAGLVILAVIGLIIRRYRNIPDNET